MASRVLSIRILSVLAASMLVAAFAIALLAAPDMPLQHVLVTANKALFGAMRASIEHISPLMWDRVVLPVLARPAWVLPASAGVILAGLAFSLATHEAPQRNRL